MFSGISHDHRCGRLFAEHCGVYPSNVFDVHKIYFTINANYDYIFMIKCTRSPEL